jgi:hypothetical protein
MSHESQSAKFNDPRHSPAAYSQDSGWKVAKMNTMEFQLKGKLVDFNLTEVIQFLGMNRKSGELAIHNSAHDKVGSLFFLEGELVHASMNGNSGMAAFDRILHLTNGYFIFLAELRTESRSIKQSIQVLLMEAHTRNDERLQLQGELPAADTVLTLANDIASVPPLNTCEWKALSFVNGRRSIARICQKFGDELGALWALHGLYRVAALPAHSPSPPRVCSF